MLRDEESDPPTLAASIGCSRPNGVLLAPVAIVLKNRDMTTLTHYYSVRILHPLHAFQLSPYTTVSHSNSKQEGGTNQ